jgi:hypothetical protein
MHVQFIYQTYETLSIMMSLNVQIVRTLHSE